MAGLKPAASSTRNWRAINCATPRFGENMRFSVSGQTCGQTENLRTFKTSGEPKKSVFSRDFSVFQNFRFEIGGLHPKLARYHLRYASKRIKTIEFCCGQLCGQPRILTVFSELVKCEKSSAFKGFRHSCWYSVEQETTSTRNWRATNCATPRNQIDHTPTNIISY